MKPLGQSRKRQAFALRPAFTTRARGIVAGGAKKSVPAATSNKRPPSLMGILVAKFWSQEIYFIARRFDC
jgi:hypothetical protein